MIRRKHSRGLARSAAQVEDVNPSSALSNMADCMLVLAVGLLVALVAHYGVDLTNATEVVQGKEIETSALTGDNGEVQGQFEELGTVYRDSATGNLYMVEKDD